ncbi:hypothetical protein LINPERPRIM_LOCUS32144 [Linum perenne]
MMLRFRPIAPKPAAGIDSTRSRPLPKVRTKRKYVRVTSGTRRKKKDNNMKKLADDNRKRFSDEEAATSDRTLQLLPETSSEAGGRRRSEDTALESTVTENNNNNNNNSEEEGGGEVVKEEELDEDTCPVFVSDGEGKVVWVNEAYREMVVDQGRGGVSKVRVVLVVAEKLRPCLERCLPFNCWVSVRIRVNNNNDSNSWYMRVPCDVWKMEQLGFVWRLDVKLALKLGTLS